jgi:hypothetical protein
MNDENIKNCWCEEGMSVNIDMPSRAERFWKKIPGWNKESNR